MFERGVFKGQRKWDVLTVSLVNGSYLAGLCPPLPIMHHYLVFINNVGFGVRQVGSIPIAAV